MSRELMVVDQPGLLQGGLDPTAALRQVYRCYGFLLPEEVQAGGQTLIVAAQTGEDADPVPISRDDYLANVLDPVRFRATRGKSRRGRLCRVYRVGQMLVFFFEPES